MIIRDRLEYKTKTEPLVFSPDSPVREAIKEMAANNYGAVIIVNDDKTPAGIVSERDIVKRLLVNDMDVNSTTLGEIMTKNIYVAKEDDDLIHWLRVMSNERFRHLPIVDKDNKVLCMMSQGDFVSYTWPELIEQFKETAKASIAPNYQVALIILACLLYFVMVPVLFHLFN